MSGERASLGLHTLPPRDSSNGHPLTTILGETPRALKILMPDGTTITIPAGTDLRLTRIDYGDDRPPRYNGRIGNPVSGLTISREGPEVERELAGQIFDRLLPLAPVETTPLLAATARRARTGNRRP